MTTTFERLQAIIAKDYQLSPGRITLDAPLEALGIDSLGLADMLFTVEDEFQITLPMAPVELPTIADVVAYIDGLIAMQSHEVDPQDMVTMHGPLTL
jgi:acyl carrier protein